MRHAFLIIAHNNWPLLARLVKKLDHPDNDIYLHIDKKSKLQQEVISQIEEVCQYSKVKFIKRYKITWGGYSQINGEMRLFEEAKKGNYDYYHIVSGIDFPIKSMEYIHKFFVENQGFEFVHFCDEEITKASVLRFAQFRFLQEMIGKKKRGVLCLAERISLNIQRKLLKVNRQKKYQNINFKCGSNWCSVTDEFVSYLLSQEHNIKKMFAFSVCCDECFLQTMLYNSVFKKNIYYGNGTLDSEMQCLRSVDWKRGNPYTYQESDYEELVNSGNLFCRKVSDSEPKYEKLVSKLEML